MCTINRSFLAWIAVLILAAVAAPSPSAAQQQPAAAKKPKSENLKLFTYEVGDLVVNVPDYSLTSEGGVTAAGGEGGGMFGGGGGAAVFDDRQITMDPLIDTIVDTVAPDSWAENGTGPGQIRPLGSALVVLQTEEVHQLISGLLDQLRDGSATRRTVSIDARWLLLDSDNLDRLVKTNDDGERKLDQQILAEFTRQPTSLRGITNCFSGQGVYLISGTRRNIVSSYIPVVGSVELRERDLMFASGPTEPRIVFAQFGGDGNSGAVPGDLGGGRSVGYQPIIEKPNFGVTLEIRPTLVLDAKAAVVDLKSTVTFPAQELEAIHPAAAPGMPTVDRLAIQSQELATTLRVPLGEPVLVGGMTYMAPSASPGGAEAPVGVVPTEGGSETQQLYLVLELR